MTGIIGAHVARGSMLFLISLLGPFTPLHLGERLGINSADLAKGLLGGLRIALSPQSGHGSRDGSGRATKRWTAPPRKTSLR